MKKFALSMALLAGLPLALAAQVTKEDIKKLAAAGISDDVILSYVKSNGPVVKLSAEDIVELKQAGASEKVLTAVLGAATAPAAPAYTPRTAESPVYPAPTTTYVYDSSPYYSPYYSSYYYGGYYGGYYPRYYYSSYCYPRTSFVGFCPSISLGFYGGRYYYPRTGVTVGLHARR